MGMVSPTASCVHRKMNRAESDGRGGKTRADFSVSQSPRKVPVPIQNSASERRFFL